MTIIQDLVRDVSGRLRSSGIESADQESRWIVSAVAGLTNIELIARSRDEVHPRECDIVMQMVSRRIAGEPLQYILGEAPFRKWMFKVDQRVLIPRPETEKLVDLALGYLPERGGSVLDIGTGTGCIAISIKLESPSTEVAAIDVSREAIDVARGNAAILGAEVFFERCDILIELPSRDTFDIIVSNPPYIPFSDEDGMDATVKNYEPRSALFAGNNGMVFYERLAAIARVVLKAGGWLITEIHSPNVDTVSSLLLDSGMHAVRIEKDFAGRPRYAICQTALP